jgi:hypothetical protein
LAFAGALRQGGDGVGGQPRAAGGRCDVRVGRRGVLRRSFAGFQCRTFNKTAPPLRTTNLSGIACLVKLSCFNGSQLRSSGQAVEALVN